mgnify:CR=1 FL=1
MYIGFKMGSSPRLKIGAATLAWSEHANAGLQQIWEGGGHLECGPVKVSHSQEPIVMIAATRLYAILNMLLNNILHFQEHSTFRYEQG